MSSRTQSRRQIKADILVVGIDVAKRTHVAAIRKPDGTKEKPFPSGMTGQASSACGPDRNGHASAWA